MQGIIFFIIIIFIIIIIICLFLLLLIIIICLAEDVKELLCIHIAVLECCDNWIFIRDILNVKFIFCYLNSYYLQHQRHCS